MLRRMRRAILADDMGLGKTIQAVAAAAQKHNRHILIITLNGLQNAWRSEICELLGDGQDIEVYDGKQVLCEARWVIIHYEAARLARNLNVLCSVAWDVVIVDEAHRCKSRKRKTKIGNATNFGCVDLLSRRCYNLYLLTGTPMRDNPADVWPLLHFINYKLYPSFWRWIEKYVVYEQTPFGKKPVSYRNLPQLSEELGAFTIRRTKRDVIKQLPPKRTHVIKCTMKKKQSLLYQQMVNQFISEIQDGVFVSAAAEVSRIMRLRQIATDASTIVEGSKVSIPSGKMETLKSLVEKICVDRGEKLVVFSNWSRVVERAEAVLSGVNCVTYTGDTPSYMRANIVRAFQEDPNVKVFIGTIGAAGTGITLTAASKMVFLDRAWTPDDNSQAENRIYARMNDVHGADVYNLITQDTIDESVYEYVEEKEYVVDQVISGINSDLLK